MSRPGTLDPGNWRRLLVLAPNWIGDAVMAEPAIRAVHQAHPHLEIIGCGRPAPMTAWAGSATFTRIDALDDRGLAGPFRAGAALKPLEADAVLILRGSFRSALLARAAGVPIRVGVDRDARRWLLTHPVAPPDSGSGPRSTNELYEALAAALGVTVHDRAPRLTPTIAGLEATEEMFRGLPRPVVGLVPGGSKPPKRWPADRWARLVERCGDRIGCAVLFGSPDEREVLDAVLDARRDGPEIVDLSGRGLDLESLPAAVGRCEAVVTNDTGPRHLAIAQDVPTVSLFGPTDHRWTIVPGARERMILAEPFLDEAHVADRHPEACRIDRIPVGDVADALHRILDGIRIPERVSSAGT